MAKTDSRYIQFYTSGSVACKVELRQEQEWAPLPETRLRPRTVIHVDPVALVGIFVAVCMLIMMAVGIQQLNQSRREVAALESYVAQLTAENKNLEESYASSYDLEEIRREALKMNLVPAEEVPHTLMKVTVPQQTQIPEEGSAWDRLVTALTDLFA